MLQKKQLLAIFLPAILLVAFGLFIQVIRYEPLYPKENQVDTQHGLSIIPIFPDDPVIGYSKAPITLIAFEDFGCAGCATQMDILKSVMQKYPKKIRLIWKGLAVNRIPYPSDLAQDYGYCAAKLGKFTEFEEQAFAHGDSLDEKTLHTIAGSIGLSAKELNTCLAGGGAAAHRQKIEDLAHALNVQSVPAIFVNNTQIQPPTYLEGWESLLKL